MCGINGIILKNKTDDSFVKQQLSVMNHLIIHRGPDAEGVFTNNSKNYTIGMAMRRLSIIDLNTGNQPMFSKDKNIAIVFNGEIYNFKTLRNELELKGTTFKTTSDTEVILKLYETYGADCFSKLDGMFGFSIYDYTKNKVFIARDFFGEKPLYYTNTSNQFFWASELKSIINIIPNKPEISKAGLNLFFRLTYIPAPYTIYDGIHKLEPNSYIEYDLKTFSFTIKTIHQNHNHKTSTLSFDDAKKLVKDMVCKSVETRSISDVPLGTFLSGGVDSSVISFCLSKISNTKIDTFSIGFEKASYDETDKSRIVAKIINSNHHEFIIDETDLKNNISEIVLNFDEPFADSSALPTYLVANKTKSHVKVALTGDGGDEVFGGYNKYYIGRINNKYTGLMPKFAHKTINKYSSMALNRKDDNRGFKYKLNKMLNVIDYSGDFYWNMISLGLNENDIGSLLNPKYQDLTIFNYYKNKTNISTPKTLSDFRVIDKHISLEGDMLVKVDRTSMLNSLECRSPFLNKNLFDFTMNLPEDYLLNKWSKKHILKAAFKEDFPENFLEKSKQGFGVPIGDWLRKGMKKELESYIEPSFLKQQDIFNVQQTISLIQNHLTGKRDNTFKVWAFFCFQKWYRYNILNN
ncbi:asparagine synthase (glutamine-hydrolyzing) [Meridianimaribacter flavus]|jgi:asparagine synthase (glutamine-hydrolysing)|uniref:asparagine synthase (glutamine-hydrolyzing) n=1 Tax=Meridianimaribacter flavus TaxID=571115 RepID=A0ABY2G7P0_9FLAO|nr:asparagine synthase (glutamine-hydrolyzing) [Meridianimaribacter flavus]RYH74578.1 asparagine synthase (glutamine-hydrolyzing) [Flavobacteriaceae bacterium 144Ye]TDY12392.1 asparagine synthase (glutamine-hydrolysing) [Meridianimaribacter flavus]